MMPPKLSLTKILLVLALAAQGDAFSPRPPRQQQQQRRPFQTSSVFGPTSTPRVDPNVVQEIRSKKNYFSNRVEEIRRQASLRSNNGVTAETTAGYRPTTSSAGRGYSPRPMPRGNNYFQSRIEDCRKGTLLRNIEAAKAARGVKSTVPALKDASRKNKERTSYRNNNNNNSRSSFSPRTGTPPRHSTPTYPSVGGRQYADAPPRRPPPRRLPPPPPQRFQLDDRFTYPSSPSVPAAAGSPVLDERYTYPSTSSSYEGYRHEVHPHGTNQPTHEYPYPRLVEPARTVRYTPPPSGDASRHDGPLVVGRGSLPMTSSSSSSLDLYKPDWSHCDTRWY